MENFIFCAARYAHMLFTYAFIGLRSGIANSVEMKPKLYKSKFCHKIGKF